ncbi:MAG: hypothetical protein IJ237_04480 [Oscillospiraceae bacterium]|nr:hypothetical protein [Oscillospiraceae bacterium]
MRFCTLIFSLLFLAVFLTGCGVQEAAPTPTPEEPASFPEPVATWKADIAEIDAGLSVLTPLCAMEGGFYCASYERIGEEIPPEVLRQAKLRNREVVNDGRYDVYGTRLFFLDDAGTLTPLEEFTEIAEEENTGNWKEFACLRFLKELAPDKNGNLITLEYCTVSGNSAPESRAQMVIGKNYLEYQTLWHVRTLSPEGAEQKSEAFGENEAKAFARFQALTRRGNAQAAVPVEEVPFLWEEVGVSPDRVLSSVKKTEEGSYCFLTGSSETGAQALVTVSRREGEEPKLQLRLATSEATPALLSAVDTFHAGQNKVYITIVPICEEDPQPEADLYYLSAVQRDAFGRAGILADLYPFLDAEKAFKRSDFFPSVLSGLEQNGALLSTGAGMSFETVIGDSSFVGGEPCWTYDEFLAAWSSLGLGTDAFEPYTTCYDVLAACLRLDFDAFVDRDAQTCSFNGEEFAKLLYFTGNFRRSFEFDRTWSDVDNTDIRIRSERQLLLEKTITSFRDAQLCGYEFPHEITFVGYPTLGRAGSRMILSTLDTGCNFSMGKASEHKEAAWSFLRTFFMQAYQQDYWYFPTNIHVFNRQIKEAMETEPLLDQWGNQVISRQTGEPMIKSLNTVYLSNYVPVEIYPLTESKAAMLVSLVTEGVKSTVPDEEIISLVLDISSDYYNGIQTLEEAAASVQHAIVSYLEAES